MSHIEHNKVVNLLNCIFQKDWSITDYAQGSSYHDIIHGTFDEYFIKNLFKKAENIDLGVDPKQVALEDFKDFLLKQEDKVVKVQAVLDNLDANPRLKSIMRRAQRTFGKMFHDFHPALIKPRFTLGATITLPKGSSVFARVKASEGHKVLEESFRNLYPDYSEVLLDSYPHTEGNYLDYVKINVVSKTARIGRIVGSPPSSMLAFQCGMGDYFESKLVRFAKINLKTAQEKHRSLAMEHSLNGCFSTMDQRKASDNILRILALFLVPETVGIYMDAISPRRVQIDGEMYYTHMLCAAGNGFNTSFQTLLFWVLITAIQKEVGINQPVYVYGDDVIVHESVYDSVCKVFPLLGLEINQDKSFKDGPFRESCGGDYLYGNNVRAFYATTVPTTTPEWIRFINGIRRVGYYHNADVWRSDSIKRLWFWSILHIKPEDRLFCPRHYGDAGINCEESSLYRFGTPALRDAERIKYPGEGYDCQGNPFGAETICIYTTSSAGDKTTFAEESKGLKAGTVVRLLPHASVKNSGLVTRFKPSEGKPPVFYPAVYGGAHKTYKKTFVPYTLRGQAPENIDDLFKLIKEGNGAQICDSQSVIDRYDQRRTDLLNKFVGLLTLYNAKNIALRDEALQDVVNFKL